MSTDFAAGERFAEMSRTAEGYTGIWAHLGWTLSELEPGRATLEWEPGEDHSFPTGKGWVVHGGMVTALLDTAMGQATWSLLDRGEAFLTADLRTEFFRPTTPGRIVAKGRVLHKTRRVTFAAADLFDAQGKQLASCRGTQITIQVER